LARLRQDVIGEGSGAHGKQVVAAVAERLSAEYRRGFSKRNLRCMLRFAEVFLTPRLCTHCVHN
jgi:hypothetical protein